MRVTGVQTCALPILTKLVKENRIAELKKELKKIFSELSCLGEEKETINKLLNKYFKEDAQ